MSGLAIDILVTAISNHLILEANYFCIPLIRPFGQITFITLNLMYHGMEHIYIISAYLLVANSIYTIGNGVCFIVFLKNIRIYPIF